jgi:hypothetical protein
MSLFLAKFVAPRISGMGILWLWTVSHFVWPPFYATQVYFYLFIYYNYINTFFSQHELVDSLACKAKGQLCGVVEMIKAKLPVGEMKKKKE